MKKKFLVLRFSSLGDIVLTSSTLINIKITYPSSTISFLCKERYKEIAEQLPGIDEILTIPDKISLKNYYKFILELDNNNFSDIVDLHGNFRSWVARKLITADNKVVYPKRRMERTLLVKSKIVPRYYPHTIDSYNHALRELGIKTYCHRPQLSVENTIHDNEINEFLRKNNDLVVVAPGATHRTKQWPIDNFVELAKMLHENEKLSIVWAITESELGKPTPKDIVDSRNYLELVNYPIEKLSNIISKAKMTIANDSGVMHISSAVGTPVTAIFGPTHPALGFYPKGLYDYVVQTDESCRPCSLHGAKECYRDSQYCFDKLEPERIYNNIKSRLDLILNQNKAVFVDRDGTIIVEKYFQYNPDEIELIDGSAEGLRILQEKGFKLIVVSNQSGVARGKFDIENVEMMNQRLTEILADETVYLDAIYYCPHYNEGTIPEYSIACNCRKPDIGMAEQAAHQFSLNLRNSFVIGDKLDDINLGQAIGAKSFLVKTGYGAKNAHKLKDINFDGRVKIKPNLLESVKEIVGNE
jgi:D,D-heptose 1,7-bisphosphate phosphatase